MCHPHRVGGGAGDPWARGSGGGDLGTGGCWGCPSGTGDWGWEMGSCLLMLYKCPVS